MNGAKGVVVRLTRDTKRPVVRFADGVERVVMNETFSISSAGRVVAQRVQLPLDLGETSIGVVQCAVRCVLCAVCGVQCAVCSVQCAVCGV